MDLPRQKSKFLKVFEEAFIVSDACEKTGIKRHKVEYWRRHDPEFREALELVELKIIDKAKKLILIKTGILPGIQENHKWQNDHLLALLLKREQVVVNVQPAPAPLQIAGLTPEILSNLAKAEPQKTEEVKEQVSLEGVLREKKVTEIKEPDMIQ